MTPKRLKLERRLLLAEIHRRHRAIADVPSDALRSPWRIAEWEDALEFGPVYQPREWLPGCSDSQRIRLHRELTKLIREGLVVASRADDTRWSNLCLTTEGERLAFEAGE